MKSGNYYANYVKDNILHIFRPLAFESSFSVISKLNAGCGGYLDKIYKILDEILDLKAGFPLANFFK